MEDFEIRVPKPKELYRHYKGGVYEVVCVGRLSEKRDEIMVVYRSLERGHTWIRPFGMWNEYVEWTTSETTEDPDVLKFVSHRAQRFSLMPDG